MKEPSATRPEAIEQIADAFVAHLRAGERPNVEDYATRHPEFALELRELLPALLLLEQQADFDPSAPSTVRDRIPERREIGDFTLLREIGRGGMGVVYEAVQESLGRRVALKVLSAPMLLNADNLQRFRYEARAAAKLHHTSIVPVFGVGEHEGLHYYAMQYIAGHSLDHVIEELRQQRGGTQSHLSKRSGTPSIGPLGELTTERNGRHFHRSVARVGLQVAEALAYAHGEGLLHRDIKPSNLLLDAKGQVWVADFGLAKSECEAGLTQPGEFLGTLRYMSPERLDGTCDRRSDLYGLGATLYELLTLQPLFADVHRGRLVDSVMHDQPLAPRALDRSIPFDLETIVLKAIAKDPAARYRSADEFAEDLRRWLNDRPILARRTSRREQMWRWSRRNPLVAGLAGVIGVLLIVLTVGSMAAAWRLGRLADARTAEANRHYVSARLAEAQAARFGGHAGRRATALASIADAAGFAPTSRRLVDEALACEALTDLTVTGTNHAFELGDAFGLDFDDSLSTYIQTHRNGLCVVRSFADGRELCRWHVNKGSWHARLSGDGRHLALVGNGDDPLHVWRIGPAGAERVKLETPGAPHDSVTHVAFSPASDSLAYVTVEGEIAVVDLQQTRQRTLFKSGSGAPRHLSFSPSGGELAVADSHGVRFYSTRSGQLVDSLVHEGGTTFVAWDDSGDRLCAADGSLNVCVWERHSHRLTKVLSGIGGGGVEAAFQPHGRLLAATGWDATLRIWDWQTGSLVAQATAWASPLRFSKDGTKLFGGVEARRLCVFEVAESSVLRESPIPDWDDQTYIYEVSRETLGSAPECLTVSTHDGVHFLDDSSAAPLAKLASNTPLTTTWDGSGALWTLGANGLFHWPSSSDSQTGTLRLGPPIRWCEARFPVKISTTANRRTLAYADGRGAWVVPTSNPNERRFFGPHIDARLAFIAPNGAWLATGSHHVPTVCVWDVTTGRKLRQLEGAQALIALSPDGRWLLTRGDRYQVWKTADWSTCYEVETSLRGIGAFSYDSQRLAVQVEPNVTALLDVSSGRELVRLESPDSSQAGPSTFSPDGARLLTTSNQGRCLWEWNLAAAENRLGQLGLRLPSRLSDPDPKSNGRSTSATSRVEIVYSPEWAMSLLPHGLR